VNYFDAEGESWQAAALFMAAGGALYMLNKFFLNPSENRDDGFKNWLDESYDMNQQDFWQNSQNQNRFTPRNAPTRMPSSTLPHNNNNLLCK
jgi:hypothetical protein